VTRQQDAPGGAMGPEAGLEAADVLPADSGSPLGQDGSSGVGVLDKVALVLGALEVGPATLAALTAATGLARPTAHRLAVAIGMPPTGRP